MKIVINNCYGGFGLSGEAVKEYQHRKGRKRVNIHDIPRDDADLVAIVEEMGDEADGSFASLKIVEIPDGVDWEIEEYDGVEWVAETHRTWH